MNRNIAKFPLFTGVDSALVEKLLLKSATQSFHEAELLIKKGTKARAVFLLLDGKAGVYLESVEGKKVTVIFHQAPSLFGDIEMWEEIPYLGNVVALERCETLAIPRAQFLALVQSSHQLSINLNRMQAALTYRIAMERRIRTFGKVEHLLANVLCSYAQFYGEEHDYGILLRKEINRTELGEILGVTRQSVIKALETLQKEELIRFEGKQIVIPDLAKLRKRASDFLL